MLVEMRCGSAARSVRCKANPFSVLSTIIAIACLIHPLCFVDVEVEDSRFRPGTSTIQRHKMLCRICRLCGAKPNALAALPVRERLATVGSSAATSSSSRSLSSAASTASLTKRASIRSAVNERSTRLFSTSVCRHVPGEKEVVDQDTLNKQLDTADAIPWFMQSETITLDPSSVTEESLEAEEAAGEADGIPSEIILGHKSLLELLQEADESIIYTIPEQLEDLYDLLTRGSASGLVAKRPEIAKQDSQELRFGEDPSDETSWLKTVTSEIVEPPSIRLIPASLISAASNSTSEGPALTSDASGLGQSDSWCDWIVMVEARGSAAGTVKRLATEIGAFVSLVFQHPFKQAGLLTWLLFQLERLPPPSNPADGTRSFLDDLLGTSSSADAANPSSQTSDEIEEDGPAEMAGRAWRPSKTLSPAAQDALRALHRSSPEEFNPSRLASAFKISRESVRRILRAGKRIDRGDATWRQDARVQERQEKRVQERMSERREQKFAKEDEVIEMLRKQVHQTEGAASLEDTSEETRQDFSLEATSRPSRPAKVQTVRYEGLVGDSSGSSTASTRRRGGSAASHGDGNWCMVDAEWCVVHVMTSNARKMYDIEGLWEDQIKAAAAARRQSDAM